MENTNQVPTSDTPGSKSQAQAPHSQGTFDDSNNTLNTASSRSPPLPTASSPPVADSSRSLPRPQLEQPVQNASPEVVALRSMFPDYDDIILQSVLDSVGGNQDRAIDTLLGMSDPNFKSETRPEEPQLSQTELDEQLARRLMQEEQDEQQRQWQQQQRPPPINFQSAPRQGYQQQQQQGYQGAPSTGERDTMADFQDQFNKFAETGKKTIGSIFSKVKAKIQEFDQPRQEQGTQPTWGSSSGATQSSQPQQGYYGHDQQPSTPPQPQAAYYDPNPPMGAHSPSPPPRTLVGNPQGYDVTPSSSSAFASSTAAEGNAAQPQTQPITATQPTPIDGGRLGLLPKRPVSLARDPSTMQPQRKPDDDEDDGLEYTENPFEDSRK